MPLPGRPLEDIPSAVYSHQFDMDRRMEVPMQDEIKHQNSNAAL